MYYAVKIFEAVLFVLALSADAFVSAFAYGADGVKIKFREAMIISLVCSAFLGTALLFGIKMAEVIPPSLTLGICVSILAAIGAYKIISAFRENREERIIKVHQKHRALSSGQAFLLSIALSLDGIAAGFGSGLIAGDIILIISLSLILGMAAVLLGCRLGEKLARKSKLSLGFFSGVILIGLAVYKLF